MSERPVDERTRAALDAIATLALDARDFDDLLAGIVRMLGSALAPESVLVLLRDGDRLVVRAAHGVDDTPLGTRVGEGFAGLVAQHGEPLSSDEGFGLPLLRRGQVIGVLQLGTRKRLSPEDERLVEALGPRLATAIALHSAKADALALMREKDARTLADETMRLAAEAAALGTWDWSLQTGELHWSTQTKRIYGLPDEAPVTYEVYSAMLPPEARAMLEAAVQSALDPRGPRKFHCEHRIVRGDGVQRWLLGHGRVIFDAQDRPIRVLGTTMDVTERRRGVEDERFLARASVVLTSTLEPDDAARRLIELLVPERGDHAFVELEEGAASHTCPQGMDRISAPLRARDRTFGVVTLCRQAPFDDADRAVLEELALRAALAIDNARLFAEANAARALAEEQREEAQRASRAKDEFLAMLGHELRNPLAPIATAVRLLAPKLEGSRELSIVDRQVRHLSRLVDDLLDVSRITAGRVQLDLETVDIESIVSRAIEMASPLIEQGRHLLTVTTDRTSLRVRGDATRLSQVFSNLLSNAAKYTPTGGHLEVVAARDGDDVVVKVRDDGMGIAPELLPRVFDLFTQGVQSIDRARGGLGLGLAIVKSLVQMHQGTVEAHSEGPGRGTELTVRLPACDANEEPAASERRKRVVTPVPTLVYLVDDNVDATELLAIALESSGFSVRAFHDGPSALSALEAEAPAAAVLDIGLPVMDGYELASELRRQRPGLPLIAVTGYGQREDRERSRQAGFDAHLVKPVDLDVLEATLAGLVRSAR